MANNLEVSITANIADFQEKLLVAQQNLKDATSEMQRWAQEVQASGGANTYAVGRFKEASLATAEYTQEVAAARAGITAAIPRMNEFAGSTAVATREVLVLGREAARGNWTRMAGSLSILAQQGFGVQPAMLAAAAGVAALVGALIYLADRADKAAIAIAHIQLGAGFEGGIALSKEQIQGLIEEINKIPGVAQDDAQKIIAAFSTMRTTSEPEIRALSLSVKDYADLTNQSVDKATEALKKSFADPLKNVVEFISQFHGATEAQREQAIAAAQGGNANAAAAVMVNALRGAMEQYGKALDELAVKQAFDIFHLNDDAEATLRVDARRRAATEHIGEEAAALEILAEARRKANEAATSGTGEMGNIPTSPNQSMLAGLSDAEKLAPTITRVEELKAKVQEFTALLPAAQHQMEMTGNSKPFDQLKAAIAAANDEIKKLQTGPDLKLQKELLAQQTAMGHDLIADTRDRIAQTAAAENLGHTEELVEAKAAWTQLLAEHRLTAAQRKQVETELANVTTQLQRQQAADAKAIAQDQAKTDIDIAKLNLKAEKDSLDAQVVAHQITADQKLAIERQLTSDLAAEEIKRLEVEQQGLSAQSVDYQRLADQIRLIRAQLTVDLAGLGKQEVAQSNKDDLEQALAWRDAVQQMGQASDRFVQDVFSGQHTLIQSLQLLTSQWLQSELAADLKYYTMKTLYSALGYADEVKNLKGGLLATLLTEQQKTTAVVAGAGERQAAESASSSGGILSLAADAVKAITIDAGKTFAGVFAFMSGLIGPAAAGPAAASEAAVLAASGPLMAFDVGAWEIPQDTLGIIHKGETIMPTSFAQGYRSAISGAGNNSGGGQGLTFAPQLSIHALDGRDVIAKLNSPTVMRWMAKSLAGYMSMNPSTRPSYG